VPQANADHPCPDADLWILAGQSNMQGCGQFTPERAAQPDMAEHPRIFAFDSLYEWVVAREPLHHLYAAVDPVHVNLMRQSPYTDLTTLDDLVAGGRASTARAAGPGMFFARHLLAHLPGDRKIALLPVAHGGTTLAQWSPDLPGAPGTTLYSAMLKRLEASGLRPRGVLWYQGESDAAEDSSASTYAARFKAFVKRLRRDTGVPDLPILTVQIGRVAAWERADCWERVREEQRLAAREIPHCYLTHAIEGELCDPIHLSVEAQSVLGRRLANIALTEVYRVGDFGRGIELDSVQVERDPLGGRFLIRYQGVTGALRAVGRPSGFFVRSTQAGLTSIAPWRVELNAAGPGTVLVHAPIGSPEEQAAIGYGEGLDPLCNIFDEADMPLPCFGPLSFDCPPAL